MIRLSGSGNYTRSRIWDGMTMTNALSNTGVETSSKAWGGWCSSQPTPRISFMPLTVASTAIRHRNAAIPKCTLRTSGGRNRYGGILKDKHMLLDFTSTLRTGDTLVPWIFMSDGTHLSNFAGDKKEWPVYMTIGNLSSKICQMPSTHSVIMVTLLPIPIKNHNIPQKRLDEQRQTNWDVPNEVLRQVLQPLTFKHNPSAESGYYNVLCVDGNFRRCKPVLAAWFAECPEYSDLDHLERHACVWCHCPKNELGDYVPPAKQHRRRDHNLYRMLSDANTKAADAEHLSRHVHWASNVFRHNPRIVSDLPKPSLLHTMQIGMHDHLQKWIFHFMKMHERLDKYNAIWLSVPAYHDLTLTSKSWGRFWMGWEGDEGNESVPVWSCNPDSMRRKPRSASRIQSHNWVHMGSVRILYVCSIYISRWCNIELHGGCLASFSYLQRCFLTRLSRQQGEGQRQYPENGTRKEAKGRWANKCWTLDTVQEAAPNEHLAGLYQLRDRCFEGVGYRLQLSEDPPDVSLGQTDSSIRSLATVFCHATWTSIWNEPQGWLERL